MLSLPSNPFP
ncbi:hypothetical protein VCHC50A1_2079, partial [Vibrio cholerae HC-50A1]